MVTELFRRLFRWSEQTFSCWNEAVSDTYSSLVLLQSVFHTHTGKRTLDTCTQITFFFLPLQTTQSATALAYKKKKNLWQLVTVLRFMSQEENSISPAEPAKSLSGKRPAVLRWHGKQGLVKRSVVILLTTQQHPDCRQISFMCFASTAGCAPVEHCWLGELLNCVHM